MPRRSPDITDVRPTPRFLWEEFAEGPPPLTEGPRRYLDDRHRRYILWAYSQRMKPAVIARELGASRRTVWKHLQEAANDNAMFRDWGLVTHMGLGKSGKAERWFCRFCGNVRMTMGDAAEEAYNHTFEQRWLDRERRLDRIG